MGNEQKPKKKFYKTWWFWTILIVIFWTIGSTANNNQKINQANNQITSSNQQSSTSSPKQVEKIQQTQEPKVEIIKVSALQLANDYDANQVAADEKYKNKIIEISGTISSIGKDILDTPYVSLIGNPDKWLNVQCMFDKSEQSKLSPLVKNTKVKLQGKISGSSIGIVIVNDCSIVE